MRKSKQKRGFYRIFPTKNYGKTIEKHLTFILIYNIIIKRCE